MCGEKHILSNRGGLFEWITPACAGKSGCRRNQVSILWDHPRMCGEKLFSRSISTFSKGSPPHVRGKAWEVDVAELKQGITPACAGKRRPSRPSGCIGGDHPRMCGEKSAAALSGVTLAGSPPHVRGKDCVNCDICI